MPRTPLHELAERGQSVWLDFISRELVTTGALQKLIDESTVTGMTSNPTIFEKAIGEGSDYDAQLRALVGAGITSPDDLFVELAVSDIQRAADTLRQVYERTKGNDGFVSLEVAPGLAHDTDATVEAATMLWEKVERPNLMIKVPATPEGIPAIETLIGRGLNINVTLIFALSAYEAVAEAYIRGLEQRAADGRSLDNRSVASFFVSRVDTEADKRIEQLLEKRKDDKPDDEGRDDDRRTDDAELRSLLGTAAIANAVLAYERFEELFRGERFRALREKGAAPQRPLWASTSAKNPKYRDVVYAEALIGPDTVDTMPLSTIDAFADHGVVAGDTVRSDYPKAHELMDRLEAAGIDVDDVTQTLLDAGVDAFAASYSQLIQVIAEKADAINGGLGHAQVLDLGASTRPVIDEAANRGAAGVARRIWERDPELWKPGDADHAQVIGNRLGWLDVVERMRTEAASLGSFAAEVREEGVRDVVLLGMGGSSLGPEVLRTSFMSAAGYPTLHVLDTTDPTAVRGLDERIDPRRVLFVVASKSGGTVETLSHMAHFFEMLRSAGLPDPGRAFVAITDPGTSLAETAQERGFRRVFLNPVDIGGRYSVLSYFGMVPAALSGIDIAELLDRAAAMLRQCSPGTFPTLNVGLVLGTAFSLLHDAGRDKITILAPPRIAAFSLWAEQLIAESTGKEGKGLIPIGAEPIGEPAVYGDDRLFVALRLGEEADFDAGVGALRSAGQPVISCTLRDLYDLGAEFVRWEFATAVAAAGLRIDPFDEPNVTESKDNTKRLLQVFVGEGSLPESSDDDEHTLRLERGGARELGTLASRLQEFLGTVEPGDYVGIQAYVTPTGENQAALQELRVAIRDQRRVATTLGFGPRFLHSTGQLHKGGPNSGVYVQIVVDADTDVEIPGQRYSFAVLERAQADGDLQSLLKHERRAIRLHLGGAATLSERLRGLAAELMQTAGAR